MLDYMIHHPV